MASSDARLKVWRICCAVVLPCWTVNVFHPELLACCLSAVVEVGGSVVVVEDELEGGGADGSVPGVSTEEGGKVNGAKITGGAVDGGAAGLLRWQAIGS